MNNLLPNLQELLEGVTKFDKELQCDKYDEMVNTTLKESREWKQKRLASFKNPYYMRYTYKCNFEFAVKENKDTEERYLIGEEEIPNGSIVHKGVWKKDEWYERGTYIN